MKRRIFGIIIAIALCIGLMPTISRAANSVASMKITDHLGNVLSDGDTIQIQVGTTVKIDADYYDVNGIKITPFPTPSATWTVESGGEGYVALTYGNYQSEMAKDKRITGLKATEEPLTITVSATYQKTEYTTSFRVEVVETSVIDGIAIFYSGNPLDLNKTFEISTGNALLYAYPTISGVAHSQTLTFSEVEWSVEGEGIVWSNIYNSKTGISINGGSCTEGATGTLTAQAAGFTQTLSLKVPKKEYLCGLYLYPTGSMSTTEIAEALTNLGITIFTEGSNFITLPSIDVGSEEIRMQYHEQFPSGSTNYSAAAFAKTVNDLFFDGQDIISEAAIDRYYFSKSSTGTDFFVLELRMLPGETVTPDTNSPATLQLVNLNGGDLEPAVGGGYQITDEDITTISGLYLYDTVDVNANYKGNDPDNPVTSWQYAEIITDSNSNPIAVKPIAGDYIQGPLLLTSTDVVLLARHDTPDHYVRVILLDRDQPTDLIVQNPDDYKEVDVFGEYNPVQFDETATNEQGELLDYTYKLSLTEYKAIYSGSHSSSAEDQAALLDFLLEKGLVEPRDIIFSSSATTYSGVHAGTDIKYEGGTIEEDTSFNIATFIVSLKTFYPISLETNGNGTVSASHAEAVAGTEITLTATPKSGYHLQEWQILSGNVTIVDDKFIMPAGDVTLKAIFAPNPPPILPGAAITVPEVSGGTLIINPKQAQQGETVTITAVPDEGYGLNALSVFGSDGVELTLNQTDDLTYTFKMPGTSVEIRASFYQVPGNSLPFIDIPANAWYYDAVRYVYENGLMNGTSEYTFSPDAPTSRAMIATILWRMEGCPQVNYLLPFDDVAEGMWYTEAIRWAAAEGIVTGYDEITFAPNDPITREQFAAMLYRYAAYRGIDLTVGENTNILSYTDALDVSEYAIPAMQWTCGSGIINGIDGALVPSGTASRAQAATILMRFCNVHG